MPELLKRAEVHMEQTWNLDDLFATPEAFEDDLSAFPEEARAIRDFQGRLREGPKTVLACLGTYLRIMERQGHLYAYAFNRLSSDGLSPANQDAHSRAVSLMTLANAESAFMVPELLSLPPGTLEDDLDAEPGLAPWRRWLERLIVRRAHLLPSETEKAIASLSEVLWSPGSIYRTWRTTDLAFPLPHYERVLERSADTTLRRNAYKTLADSLSRYRNTVAAIWGTQVKANVILARLRGYGSAIEMKLSEQEVPVGLYDRLHEVILTVVSGLSVLGDEYTDVIRTAFRDRWIDWANNEGKTGDCYAGGGNSHPYVLIGWDGTMRSSMILAHELGHAAHYYLTYRNQMGYDRVAPLLLGEAASTTAEAIVGDWLMQHSDSLRGRRWFIIHLLTSYYHNFVRHLIESELQRRLYAMAEADVPITADLLCKVQGDILAEFWGDTVTVDEGARLTWMRQVHYYDQRLYSWSYSGGLTIGVAVVQAIRREGPCAAERWVRALKAGGSMPPLELARLAGVDLTRPKAIREAVEYVAGLIDELERSFSSGYPHQTQ